MRDDQHRFLTLLGQLPARLTVEQTAWVLNCQAHDVPVLVSKRLLKPLGNPPANGVKYFATALVLESSKDPAWLAKMTNAIHDYWRQKNGQKRLLPRACENSSSSTSAGQNETLLLSAAGE